MTNGIMLMNELGYKVSNGSDGSTVIRKFVKYDNKGNITDTINYFYSKDIDNIDVFTNNLTYECGSRLDIDLLNAILVNLNELETYL